MYSFPDRLPSIVGLYGAFCLWGLPALAEEEPPAPAAEAPPLPARMPARRYQPVPPGYRLERKPDWMLIGVGAGLFAVSYGLPVVGAAGAGGFTDAELPWAIPVAGPIIQLVNFFSGLDGEGAPIGIFTYPAYGFITLAAVGLSALQLGGPVLITLGIVKKREFWVREKGDFSLRLQPMVPGGDLGWSLTGTF